MRTVFTLFISLLFISNSLTAGDPGKDYIITLNGIKLTGDVKDIFFSNIQSRLSFENDFGNLYSVHPACIHGFAFREGEKTIYYESKYLGGRWDFLKVEKRGSALSLYRSSERKIEFTQLHGEPIIETKKVTEIWLQFQGQKPFRVFPLGYKKLLKQKFAHYPELANRIGKKGYKFRDLPKIVELYNELHDKNERNL